MGQVILGFRSLLIKLALFVVFAALLAWALGGTLFPRPEVKEFESILFGGHRCYWKVSMGGNDPGRGRIVWQFMAAGPDGQDPAPIGMKTWVEGAGPIAVDDNLYYAGLASHHPQELWRIERIDESLAIVEEYLLPDRLAVEQQLARLQQGLEVQGVRTIEAQRGLVLDPPGHSVEEEAREPSVTDP